MKKCPSCSTENEDDSKHCKECAKDLQLVPVHKPTPYQKGDYWSMPRRTQSSAEITPQICHSVERQYVQYMTYQRVYAPSYRVKFQNIYYIVKSYGFKYQCPKCGYIWSPNVRYPHSCANPKCHVNFGFKVKLGIDLLPWLIPLGVSVEISK